MVGSKADFKIKGDRKYFLIFDIDGTLRPDQVTSLDHRYPRINPETAMKLQELNNHKQVDVVILTARSYVDIFRSNIPKSITKYCGFGKQIIENDILKYAREEFVKAYDETVCFIDIIKDLLGFDLISELDFLTTPGDFAIYFESANYQAKKDRILEIIQMLLRNSSRWSLLDFGKELVFKDNKYKYNKGDAARDIIDKLDFTETTEVCLFGDSEADYAGMLALRQYQSEHPNKRIKIKNFSVGPLLNGKEQIDIALESYKETIELVNEFHSFFCK